MNLDYCKKEVEEIRKEASDPEIAHGMEDDLYLEFVRHVAIHGDSELSEMAKEILKTENISFPRWTA